MSFVIMDPIVEEGVINSKARSIGNRGIIQFCST
jgi:hypothetical protein